MPSTFLESDSLTTRLRMGQPAALTELLSRHRDRLRIVVELRMDDRLRGRLDPSDVLQEAFLEATTRYAEFSRQDRLAPPIPGCVF